MKIKHLLTAMIVGILFFPITAIATSSYGEMDVYFDNKLLPGEEIAKPTLKINEPFSIKVNITVYQEYKVSGTLTSLGKGYFEVIDGPSEMDQYSRIVLKANESHVFEWTVIPTDKWADGSMPINFHYSMVEKGNSEPIVNSEFTVAYCTISNEYYKGKTPTPEKPPVSETESSPSSASTPAFTLIGAISVLALIFALFRR